MTPDSVRHLLGGYATGTLTGKEKRLLFEAALMDQELFDAIASDESLRGLLDAPESRGYLIEALEEQPAEPRNGAVVAMPEPQKKIEHHWMRYGAIAASFVVLLAASVYGILNVKGPAKQAEVAVNLPQPVNEGNVSAPAPTSPAPAVGAPKTGPAKSAAPRSDQAAGAAASGGGPGTFAQNGPDREAVTDKLSDQKAKEQPAPPAEPVAVASEERARAEKKDQRKAEADASQQPRGGVAAEAPTVTAQQSQPLPQQIGSGLGRLSNSQSPDGSRASAASDASEIYMRQQMANTSNASNFRPAAPEAQAESSSRNNKLDEAVKRREQAPAPKLAAAKAVPVESPGVRFQIRRRDSQGNWATVLPSAQFQSGDEIALHVEQNVAGELRVFYQDPSLKPVALALLDSPGGKQTAPFKLAATGTAQFTIVLRGAAPAIPAASPSQVTESEGPNVYVVRPNAPGNSPVVARISLNVR